MSFDEDDVRRALDARSAPPTAEFRGRLNEALAHGRPRPDPMPVMAAIVAMVLALATIGVFIFVRAGAAPKLTPGARSSPVAESPSPSPGLTVFPGVLTRPPGPIAMPAYATLSAPTPNVVWALMVDHYLYRSTDRGNSWQQRPLPQFAGQQPEISFVSDTEGWFSVVGSPETQCNAQQVQIWHTTDAGATWTQMGSRGIADAQCKSGLSFIDSMHGFITGSDQNRPPVIYFTTDGGRSWKAASPLADPPGFTSQQAGGELTAGRVRSFGDVLLVPVTSVQSRAFQFVYLSDDGGSTWAYAATVPNGGGSVAFVKATYWLQLILPGQSMETNDGGASWHISSSDYSQAAPVAPEVVFADAQVGYATVRGAIQITVDGGRHWSYISTPGT